MAYDPTKYSYSELLEAFSSIDRQKYPENYALIEAELRKRGLPASTQIKDDVDEERVNREAKRLLKAVALGPHGCLHRSLIVLSLVAVVGFGIGYWLA